MREGDSEDVMRGDLEAPGLSSRLAIREPTKCLGRFERADLHKTVPLMAQLALGDVPALWSQAPAALQPGMCHTGTGAVAHVAWPLLSCWQRARLNLSPSQPEYIPALSFTRLQRHGAGKSQLDGHGGAE